MYDMNDVNVEVEGVEAEAEEKQPVENPFPVIAPALGNLREYGRYALYAIKAEITINELRFCLYWQSLLEFAIISVSFVMLLFARRFLIFMHIFHFARPILCLKVISSLPRSHDIYEEITDFNDTSMMQSVIYSHFRRANRIFTKYFVLTVICFVLDFIGCVIGLFFVGNDHNSDAFYSLITWVFLCFDTFLVFWYNSLRWAYPDIIWHNVRRTIKEGITSVQELLKSYMNSVKDRFSHN